MEQILDLPSVGERTLRYAGFWIRFAAYIIDYIVVSIASWIIMAVFGFSAAVMDPTDMNWTLFAVVYVAILATWLIYHVAMETSSTQATLGKMAVGIKIGKANGERLTVLNAVGRFFGKILSALILWIGYIMAGWDPKKQALHDKIANTYVFYSGR
jgi:uncharacterized RDD family membrane protein YckC